MAEIAIKANGAEFAQLDWLVIIQDSLKELSEENYTKLHDLIVTKGFDSPIQVWRDPADSSLKVLDGTQRVRVLKKLRDEGYTIPLLPVDVILADNLKDARERLLTKVSVYGKVTEEGLYEFTNFEDAIIEPDFAELLDIPGIDLNNNDVEDKTSGEPGNKQPQLVQCPQCQTQFQVNANKV